MNDSVVGELKPDVTAIQAVVSRGAQGLNIEVRASRRLEEFFKNLSNNTNDLVDLRVSGRLWTPKDGKGTMNFYAMPPDPGLNGVVPINSIHGVIGYRIDKPGTRIIEYDKNTGGNIVNISFLRLIGISSDEGMSINVKGVYGEPQVRQIYEGIIHTCAVFYESFLKPLRLSVTIRED